VNPSYAGQTLAYTGRLQGHKYAITERTFQNEKF